MSNDLINRKSLLKDIDEVIEYYSYEKDGAVVMDVLNCVRDMVNDMPTAYDIDKVIEQLKEYSFGDPYGHELVDIRDAIEIVKKGDVE